MKGSWLRLRRGGEGEVPGRHSADGFEGGRGGEGEGPVRRRRDTSGPGLKEEGRRRVETLRGEPTGRLKVSEEGVLR